MARTKKTVVSGITREQAEQAFADFAAADAKVHDQFQKGLQTSHQAWLED